MLVIFTRKFQPLQVLSCHDTYNVLGAALHEWTVYVKSQDDPQIKSVLFELHPTFSPPAVTISQSPFQVTRTGWGIFTVNITVTMKSGEVHKLDHKLSFKEDKTERSVDI